MSSTTIIYKAFEDLGLFRKQFTQLVMSILILEDILAIVLMVMLSTMSVSNNVEGMEMLFSIGKLCFFLVLWFVVGIYVVPLLLKHARSLMSDETLLIASLALCFIMVVFAQKVGFSPAFGAFIMGSILAETVEAEHIDRLVKPVKDLFGAIFFVSVGMMVDPGLMIEYIVPIIVITLAILVGQCVFGSFGVLLSGQPLKTAMQCGFSLTQIGEFAFIIASLGVSLGVTSDFLYPIVVAVSVITTFMTPYMIRLAEPASDFVESHLPKKWHSLLTRYASSSRTMNHESIWKKYIMALVKFTFIYSVVCIAIMLLSFRLLVPLCAQYVPGMIGSVVAAVVTILFMSPFLRSIMIKKNHSEEFVTLWHDSKGNRAPLIASILFRIVIAIMFVMAVISKVFELSSALVFGMALILVTIMIMSRRLKLQSIQIERIFFKNLRSRDVKAEYMGEKKPEYAGRLLSRDMHLADYIVPHEVAWAGQTLADLNFGKKYGVQIASILRGKRRINIPKASDRLFPQDRIQVIAADDELTRFAEVLNEPFTTDENVYEEGEIILRQFVIDSNSQFKGKNLKEAGFRDNYHCLIVGVERGDGKLHAPNPRELFDEGDVVWIVGESKDIHNVAGAKSDYSD